LSDPFGLSGCDKDLEGEALEKCEAEQRAKEERELRARAACRADLRQAATSLLLDVSGVGVVDFVKNIRQLRDATSTVGTMARSAANTYATPGVMMFKINDDLTGGTPNPFGSGNKASVLYDALKFAPFGVGTGLELSEALNSCLGGGGQ
jgi:hypothetical protein